LGGFPRPRLLPVPWWWRRRLLQRAIVLISEFLRTVECVVKQWLRSDHRQRQDNLFASRGKLLKSAQTGWKLQGRLPQAQLVRLCYALLVATAIKLLWDGLKG